MRTFLVDRVIDSGRSEGAIVPVICINTRPSLDELDSGFRETTVRNFELRASASGAIILVVEVEPIELDGERISGIYEYINFCPTLQKGDRLAISRSLDYETHYQSNPTDYLKTPFAAYLLHSDESRPECNVPEKCPECGSSLIRLEDDITRCYNSSCLGSLASALKYWWAWWAWYDQSWGQETSQPLDFLTYELIHQLIENLKLKSVADLYLLNSQQIINSTVLSEEEATAIINALNHSKTCHWTFLVSGLGIRFMGFYRAIKLEKRFSALEAIVSADLDLLKSINWSDSRIVHSIYSWVRVPANLKLIRELQSLGLNTSDTSNSSTSSYSWQEVADAINDKIGETIEPIIQGIARLQNWFLQKIEEYDKKFTQNDESFSLIKAQVNQSETLLNSGLRKLSEEYRQIQTELYAIRSALEKSTQENSDSSFLTEQYNQILSDLHTIRLLLKSSVQEIVDNPLTSEEFKKYQTQEAKRQQSQLEKIEKTLDKQLEEIRRKLQQFVTSSVQNVTKASAKVSDLEVVLQLIDEVPNKIETQLKLEPTLKVTSDELNKLTQELADCKKFLQTQIADLIAQLLPELETLQVKQNESSQIILSRFQTQDETLLNSIQAQQEEILPHFGTLQQQITVVSEQNERLNEQVATVRSQLDLEQQTLQTQNERLQSEMQQSLKEQCTLTETLSERSQLLEEANHQLTILSQDLSPAIQLVIERLNQCQPDNTSSEALDVFRQLATQIHQANEQLQAIRPVAAPLINGLQQENAELQKRVQQTETERDRLRELLDSKNTELNQAQLTSDRLNQEKSSLEHNLSDTQSQLKIVREQYANSQNTLDRLSTELHEQLYQAQRDVTRLDLEKSDFERQLVDTRTQLEEICNKQVALEGERDSLIRDLNQVRDQLGQSERDKLSIQSQLESCELRLHDSQETLQKSQQRVLLLEEQQGQLPFQVASLEGRLEENHKTTTDLRKSVGDLQSRLTQTQVLYDQTLQHLEKCHKARTDLETQLKSVETELSETKAELQLTQKGLQGFINQGFRRDRQARS